MNLRFTQEPYSNRSPMLGAFAHPAFAIVWTASTCALIGIAMYDTASGWLMTTFDLNAFDVSLLHTATTLPIFLFTLPAGADRRHRRSASDDHRCLVRDRRIDGDLRRRGGARFRVPRVVALDDVRSQRGLVPQFARVAIDRAATRAEAGDSGGDGGAQRRLQSQPHARSCARRVHHRALRRGHSAVDFCRRQSHGDRRAHMVAWLGPTASVASRRKIEQRSAHRPSAYRQQSPLMGDAGADHCDLSVYRRVLGALAIDRPANRARRGALWDSAQRDQRWSDSRIART